MKANMPPVTAIRFAALASTAIAVGIFFAGTAPGNLKKNWTYDVLFEKSDLVVVAVAEKSEAWDGKLDLSQHGIDGHFLPQKTTFKVMYVIKGRATGSIPLIHYYKIQSKDVAIVDGPEPINFSEVLQGKQAKNRCEYLLFLTKVDDKNLGLTSGYSNQHASVRKIMPFTE